MGLRKVFFRTFHPNKVKRPFEQAAEDEQRKTNLQAIQEKEASKKRRDDNLAALDNVYKKAKSAYDLEYNNEVAQFTTGHTQKHVEYLELIDNLELTKQQHKSQIEDNFNILKEQILANQQAEEARLEVCIQKATLMQFAYKKGYNNNKTLLDNLWNEITTQMLHQDCVIGYEQLKQHNIQYVVKTKCYSLLVGYFKQLATKHIVSNDDFERYKKFLHAICNADNQLEQNIDFCSIDVEITNLLAYLKQQEQDFLLVAYKQDHLNNKTHYNNSREFDNMLNRKFTEIKKEIADKYREVLLNLTNERNKKNKDLEETHTVIKQQTETEWHNHENTYNAYLASLQENKASIDHQLIEQEKKEKDKINENYQQELKSIDASVKKITDEINSNLKKQLTQLRRAARASVINVFTSISTAIAAYFSGGLLSGFSNYIVEGVRNSLIATSLGSLESFIKDREKIGANLVFNFPQGPTHDFTPEVTRNIANQRQEAPDFSANLAKLKEEFSIFNQRVHTWQTQAEHDLFYSLNRGIFFRPNFSNAVAVYSSQSYKFNFGIDAELGKLQSNGYINVRWNINLDNNRWYGDNLMRDRDILQSLRQVSNNLPRGPRP